MKRYYSDYMTARIIRIGNSKGIRLSKHVLATYGIGEGDELKIEERQEGILLSPIPKEHSKLPLEAAYAEMAAECAEWADWDATAGDGAID
jgi:antitoxin component of MazEF toxin-antitoxin module